MEPKLLTSSSCFIAPLPPTLVSSKNPNHRSVLVLNSKQLRRSIVSKHEFAKICPKVSLTSSTVLAAGVPTSVPVRVAIELLQAGHKYLDVRTPDDFSSGHVPGAINIPYMYKNGSGMTINPEFLKQVFSQFGENDEIIVGCATGRLSYMAAADLLATGFKQITNIAGGFDAWTQSGLPTSDDLHARLPSVVQSKF